MLQNWRGRLEHQKGLLARALEAPGRHARHCAEKDGFDLAALLGLLFIPAAGFTGFWTVAADEAADFVRLLTSASASGNLPRRRLSGPTYLKLLAAPVLWALVFTRLDPGEAARSASRADRLQHAGASADLFTALGRLADSPPSVSFAAAALAAVTGPPTADMWIERACQQAHRNGARGFAAFLSQLGTEG